MNLVSVAKALASGAATQDVIEKRREICRACEFRIPGKDGDLGRCGVCGCPLTNKTKFVRSTCPKGKW